MKTLALLQLLLLPLAGLVETPKSADASTGVCVERPSALEDAWHASETSLKKFAKRFAGSSEAASPNLPHAR